MDGLRRPGAGVAHERDTIEIVDAPGDDTAGGKTDGGGPDSTTIDEHAWIVRRRVVAACSCRRYRQAQRHQRYQQDENGQKT